MRKTTIVTCLACALFLGSSTLCAMEAPAASGTGISPVRPCFFERKIDIDGDEFIGAVREVAELPNYFLINKETYPRLMKRLDDIESQIIENSPFTLEEAWGVGDEYVDILLRQMGAAANAWASLDQQKAIIEKLLKINAICPGQPKPNLETSSVVHRFEGGDDRLWRFVENIKWPDSLVDRLQLAVDLFSKLSVLGIGELESVISYGGIHNGSSQDRDILWKQEFAALLRDLQKYPTSYFMPVIRVMNKKIGQQEDLSLKSLIQASSRQVYEDVLRSIQPVNFGIGSISYGKAYEKKVERMQVSAFAKLFFPDSDAVSLDSISHQIRQKNEDMQRGLARFGKYVFQENAPNIFTSEVGLRVFNQIKGFPINSPQFKAAARFLKAIDPGAYAESLKVAGEIFRRGAKSRIAYLEQLYQMGPEPLTGTNYFEGNNFDPRLQLEYEGDPLFNGLIIDYDVEEKGTFWDENPYSHLQIVKEVYQDGSGGIEPTAVSIAARDGRSNVDLFRETLDEYAEKGFTVLSLSVGLGKDERLWRAFVKFLSNPTNVVSLAIGNLSNLTTDIAADDSEADFFKWFYAQGFRPNTFPNLYLCSRVTENPMISWQKQRSDGVDNYFAIVENTLVSRGFGKSSVEGDLGDSLQKHGVAGAGVYFSKRHNKTVQGTSFFAPLVGGQILRGLNYLDTRAASSEDPSARATRAIGEMNEVFNQALRKKKLQLTFNAGTGAVGDPATTGRVNVTLAEDLDPSAVGRGMFDSANLISLLKTGEELDPTIPQGEPIAVSAETEDLAGIETRASNSNAPRRLIKFFEGADKAAEFARERRVSYADLEKPGFEGAISVPLKFLEVSGVPNQSEALRIAREFPGIKIQGFEHLQDPSKLELPYDSFVEMTEAEILDILNRDKKTIYIKDVDLATAITLSLQWGDGVTFEPLKNSELTPSQIESLDPKLLNQYMQMRKVVVTGVKTLAEAIHIALRHEDVRTDFEHSLFTDKKLSLREIETLDRSGQGELLNQYIKKFSAKPFQIKITDVPDLNTALSLLVRFHNEAVRMPLIRFDDSIRDFPSFLPYSEYKKTDPSQLAQFLDLYGRTLTVTDIPPKKLASFSAEMKRSPRIQNQEAEIFLTFQKEDGTIYLETKKQWDVFQRIRGYLEPGMVKATSLYVSPEMLTRLASEPTDPLIQALSEFCVDVDHETHFRASATTLKKVRADDIAALLEKYPNIRKLDLLSTSIDGPVEEIVRALPAQLEDLYVSDKFSMRALDALKEKKNLKSLWTLSYDAANTERAIESLSDMKNLEIVALEAYKAKGRSNKLAISLANLENLLGHSKLRNVSISGNELAPELFTELRDKGQKFESVEWLSMQDSVVTYDSLEAMFFSVFPGLQSVEFGGFDGEATPSGKKMTRFEVTEFLAKIRESESAVAAGKSG